MITPEPDLEQLDSEFHTNLIMSRQQPGHFIRTFITPQVYEVHGHFIETDLYSKTTRLSAKKQWLLQPLSLGSWTEMFSQTIDAGPLQAVVTAYDPHTRLSLTSEPGIPEGKFEPYFFVQTSNAKGYYTMLVHRGDVNFYDKDATALSSRDTESIVWVLENYFIQPDA